MSYRHLLIVLIASALILGGCISARPTFLNLSTLEQVNRVVSRRSATLLLRSENRIEDVLSVQVNRDTTTYLRQGQRKKIATSKIERITIETPSRGKEIAAGAFVGALPGLVIMALSLTVEGDWGKAFVLRGGAVAAVAGALAMAAAENLQASKGRVVYRAPVSRYLR